MSELGEMVAVTTISGEDECPYPHKAVDIVPLTNVFPPKDGKESNDAEKLAVAMTEEYHFTEMLDIKVNGEDEKAKFSAHHLIPGNGSWPKTKLKKWVDKRYNHITENIGYDVNGLKNGVSLPGWPGIKYGTFGKAWSQYTHQKEYAIEAMKSAHNNRQFHDSHSTYSEFVVKVLDKISEKLDANVKNKGNPGCGHKRCKPGSKKKFNPPVNLMRRINDSALRLEGYLVCSVSNWQMPLFTSKWGLAYKREIEGKEASKLLSKAGKKIKADDF